MSGATVDVGVVIALQEEFDGQGDSLPGFKHYFRTRLSTANSNFRTFSFVDRHGADRAGAVVISGFGTRNAYAATEQLVQEFRPKLIVNIGIAGALDSQLRIGDVVVAEFVDNYDQRNKVVPDPNAVHSSKSTLSGGEHFRSENPYLHQLQSLPTRFPILLEHWAIQSARRLRDEVGSRLSALLSANLIAHAPRAYFGPVASGESVVSDQGFKAQLRSRHRALLVTEMESAGVLHAAQNLPVIILKVVSDLADEHKGQLEEQYGGTLRAWAMSTVFDYVHGFLSGVAEFTTGSIGTSTALLEQDLSRVSFGHMKKRHRELADPMAFVEQLEDVVTHAITPTPSHQTNIAHLVELALNPGAQVAVRIDGAPGTGKTALMSAVYYALVAAHPLQGSRARILYINLKRHLATSSARYAESPSASISLAATLTALERLLALAATGQRAILLVDGIDEYRPAPDDLVRLILSNAAGRATVVAAVGTNYIADQSRFKHLLPWLDDPQSMVTLSAIPVGSSAANNFLRAFAALSEQGNRDLANRLSTQSSKLGVRSLDLFSADLILRSLTQPQFRRAEQLSEVMALCCRDMLSKEPDAPAIDEVAALAFRYCVLPESSPRHVAAVYGRAAKLIHLHPHITDYLLAHHLVRSLRTCGRDSGNPAVLDDLNFVYQQNVTRFAKSILTASREVQTEVLLGAKVVWEKGGLAARTQACYLAGRITDRALQLEAVAWLKNCRQKIRPIDELGGDLSAKQEFLLSRTIHLSLAYLSDDRAADDYLTGLFSNHLMNDINRGFHLEYYGDVPAHPTEPLSNTDPLCEMPRTRQALVARIEAQSRSRKGANGMFNIDVFTLFSLAQHRHAEGLLSSDDRREFVALAGTMGRRPELREQVRNYVRMLARRFEQDAYAGADIVLELSDIKSVVRGGWVRRKLDLARTESVADHIYGAWLLAYLLIPDVVADGWDHYDKERILELILVHDLPEAYTGDVPSSVQDGAFKEAERRVLGDLRASQTYPGLQALGDLADRWLEFNAEGSIEAKIARECDKIENLIQLYRFGTQVHIVDFDEWSQGLRESVRTPPGLHVLRSVEPALRPLERNLVRSPLK